MLAVVLSLFTSSCLSQDETELLAVRYLIPMVLSRRYENGRVVVREPKPAARFSRTPTWSLAPRAPHLGGNKEEVLAGLGYSSAEVAQLEERGAFSMAMRSRF